MTMFIPAYDTEHSTECLPECHAIVKVHQQMEIPATFFIVGKCLEASGREFRATLDNPLFEIGSHTYSHKMLRDQPF